MLFSYLVFLILVHFRVEHLTLGQDEEVRLPVEEVFTFPDVEDPVADGVGDVEAAPQVTRLEGQPGIFVDTFRQLLVLQDDPVLESFRRRQLRLVLVEWRAHQHVAEHLLKDGGHFALLR